MSDTQRFVSALAVLTLLGAWLIHGDQIRAAWADMEGARKIQRGEL